MSDDTIRALGDETVAYYFQPMASRVFLSATRAVAICSNEDWKAEDWAKRSVPPAMTDVPSKSTYSPVLNTKPL
jgi:hypothetical protein